MITFHDHTLQNNVLQPEGGATLLDSIFYVSYIPPSIIFTISRYIHPLHACTCTLYTTCAGWKADIRCSHGKLKSLYNVVWLYLLLGEVQALWDDFTPRFWMVDKPIV